MEGRSEQVALAYGDYRGRFFQAGYYSDFISDGFYVGGADEYCTEG